MYTHLQDREKYEDRYDRLTIESARRGMVHYDKFFADFKSKLPKNDKIDKPGNAFILNIFYMQTVGDELLHRYEGRDAEINEWIARDKAKDRQVSSARLDVEPKCRHCGKIGLRIIDKDLMHRNKNANYDDPEEVLFMLRCPHCDKNSACWSDGAPLEARPTLCPECRVEMTHKTTKTKTAIHFIDTCPSCKHQQRDKLDLREKKAADDPHYAIDRAHFCLLDEEFRDRLFRMRHDFLEMAALGKEFKEREDNKHIYDAIKRIKKLKIAELSTALAPVLEKSGYIEFSLDKPEIGKNVFVGFSCLDGKNDRDDSASRKALKKLIDEALKDTNWRLMSEGISYRLGYLSGRLRAYEREEDLRRIVSVDVKVENRSSMDDGKGGRIIY